MTGEELKKKLLDAGFFPGQLAKKLNISHQSMYAKLARNDIRLGFIEQLCEVTGLQLADFIDVPRNPNESALMDMIYLEASLKQRDRFHYQTKVTCPQYGISPTNNQSITDRKFKWKF